MEKSAKHRPHDTDGRPSFPGSLQVFSFRVTQRGQEAPVQLRQLVILAVYQDVFIDLFVLRAGFLHQLIPGQHTFRHRGHPHECSRILMQQLKLAGPLEDEDALAPAEAASFLLLREQLDEVLDTLTPREKRVLQLRFGLDDGRSRTLEEVGHEFGVTRERIRQIEAKALRKLRHPSRARHLKGFLD